MPFNEALAERIRKQLSRKRAITEKKMFGGLLPFTDTMVTCLC